MFRFKHFNAKKRHVVPLGLPLEQFTPLTCTSAGVRQIFDLPPTGRLLGILGYFDEG